MFAFWKLSILVFTWALVVQAHAAEIDEPLPYYKRAGSAFACVMGKEDFARSQAEKRDVCLQIGPLFVGMTRMAAEAVLGNPSNSVGVTASTLAYVYVLQQDEIKKQTTYAVIVYTQDNQIESIQMSGDPWGGHWQFSGLMLGTSQNLLVSRLGSPLQKNASNDVGAVEFNYQPWPFSFEVKGGIISSIRLAAD